MAALDLAAVMLVQHLARGQVVQVSFAGSTPAPLELSSVDLPTGYKMARLHEIEPDGTPVGSEWSPLESLIHPAIRYLQSVGSLQVDPEQDRIAEEFFASQVPRTKGRLLTRG